MKILIDNGHGWSVETLTLCRKFYMTYSKIVTAGYEIPDIMPLSHQFSPTWSHYIILMRIKDPDERLALAPCTAAIAKKRRHRWFQVQSRQRNPPK